MAEVTKYKTPSGATIIICDDAYRDKTPEENKAALERFNKVAGECLYRDAMNRNLKQ